MNKQFHKDSQDLLNEYFGNRETMRQTVESGLLLEGLLQSLAKSSLMNDLSLKGGANLQKIFQSYRYTNDLDFACHRYPPFTYTQFVEFGHEFSLFYAKTLRESYDIPKEHITAIQPTIDQNIFQPKNTRKVTSWIFYITIPTTPQNQRGRNSIGNRNYHINLREYKLKVEISNVNSYTSQIRKSFSLVNTFPQLLIPAENTDEIFTEKILSLFTRLTFKYSDIFDLLFSEYISDQQVFQKDIYKLFQQKIYDQGLHEKIVRERFTKNVKYIIPSHQNKINFINALSLFLPNKVYQSIIRNIDEIFLYLDNRLTIFNQFLNGKKDITFDKCIDDFFKNTKNSLSKNFDIKP